MPFHEKVDEDVPPRRYQMREDLFSIGDDYWIEDEQGRRAFHVDGKTLRVRDTWVLEGPDGQELATIREKKLSLRDTITIELADGRKAAVRKELVSIREKYKVELSGEPDYTVKGDIVGHDYEVERDGDRVAEVSKRWFRVRDTYGIEVVGREHDPLMLAIAVAVEALARGGLTDD